MPRRGHAGRGGVAPLSDDASRARAIAGRQRRWSALAAVLALGGCTVFRPPTPEEPDPGPTIHGCRDWSGLDVKTLPPLHSTPWTATFDRVWATLLQRHYDPTMNCTDWPGLRLRYGAMLPKVSTIEEAYAVMSAMLGELNQTHCSVVPPRGAPLLTDEGGSRPLGLVPIQVRLLDGRMVITKASRYGLGSGLPAGATIESIQGRAMGPWLEAMGHEEDTPAALAHRARVEVARALACHSGEVRALTYRERPAGPPMTAVVGCVTPTVERLSMGPLQNVPIEVETYLVGRAPTIGVLRFNIWLLPLAARIQASIAALRRHGMKSLVLDLRGNPGGVSAMVVPLARALLSETTHLGTLTTRQSVHRFDVQASDDPFTGAMVILIDEGTASTSELFAQSMRDLGRALVFGSGPSRGAALPSRIEELPDGGYLQYVIGDYVSPGGSRIEGIGVTPDFRVVETPRDFAGGRDPVLDAAITHLVRSSE